MRNQYKVLQEAYQQVLNEALSPEDEQAIVDMFKQGIEQNIPDYTNATKLADMMGVTTKVIISILAKNNLDGLIKRGEKMLPGGEVGNARQKHPPSQYKKVEELLNKQQYDNASGPYLYSTLTAALEVNKMINGPHGEEYRKKGWVPFVITNNSNGMTDGRVIHHYLAKYMSPELRQRRKEYGFYGANGKLYGGTYKNKTGTRQQATGELGPNDPSYRAVMGRAQNINDQV
jgi:hypothetical protein